MNNTFKTEIREFFMPHEFSQLLVGLVTTLSILFGLFFTVGMISIWHFKTILDTAAVAIFENSICIAVIAFMTLSYLVQLVINIRKELLADREEKSTLPL